MREFGVPKNTTLEDSPITLRKWFATAWLMTSHWQNISFIQLFRALGKTRKTTWFILSRLRPVTEMIDAHGGPMDSEVESDDTCVGGKEKNKHANYR